MWTSRCVSSLREIWSVFMSIDDRYSLSLSQVSTSTDIFRFFVDFYATALFFVMIVKLADAFMSSPSSPKQTWWNITLSLALSPSYETRRHCCLPPFYEETHRDIDNNKLQPARYHQYLHTKARGMNKSRVLFLSEMSMRILFLVPNLGEKAVQYGTRQYTRSK